MDRLGGQEPLGANGALWVTRRGLRVSHETLWKCCCKRSSKCTMPLKPSQKIRHRPALEAQKHRDLGAALRWAGRAV